MTTLKQARIRTRLRQEAAFRKAVARKSFFKAERQKAPGGLPPSALPSRFFRNSPAGRAERSGTHTTSLGQKRGRL